jgi:prepilin-type N-terminal cleavage/methylation domain-containing protein
MIRNKTHNQFGFTLMELIVSIAIVSMMLFLINRIFFDTAQAVSRGIATSKIISNTRTIGEQIADDADHMMVPGKTGEGVLIIVNKKYTNALTLDARKKGNIDTQDVRSDQLSFIRSVSTSNPEEPIAPGSSTSFTNTTQATVARVWLGHLIQTDENGTYPSIALGGYNASTDNGPDKFATNWILGRQMLFFDNKVTTANQYARFNLANWTDKLNNIPFYEAQSDVLNTGYDRTPANDTTPPSGAAPAGDEILNLLDGYTLRPQYETFLLNNYFTFKSNRLATNPTPALSNLSTSVIAQMHPYFVNNVSDFIVEFAGDYYLGNIEAGSVGSDTKVDTDINGNIYWYGLGNPRTVPPTSFDGVGDPTEPHRITSLAALGALTDEIYIFRHDDITNWPYLLRIRYHLHDPKGELLGTGEDGLSSTPGKWFEVIVKVPR